MAKQRQCKGHQVSAHFRSSISSLCSLTWNYLYTDVSSKCTKKRGCSTCDLWKFCLVIFTPSWLGLGALAITLANYGGLHICLSFPKVRPPDSEFFIAIRAGDCHRMKELFAAGNASVADVIAPYGISPLELALTSGQIEASRLLIDEGALRSDSSYNWTVNTVLNFFADFSLVKYSINASAIVHDYVHMCSPEWQIMALQDSLDRSNLEIYQFSRLHLAVLGLSCENLSVDNVDNDWIWDHINDLDSFERTPLYWACCLEQPDLVQSLLTHGADPEISDLRGVTPLHTAAGIGSVECINVLISAGADIQAKDNLGSSPLFYAAACGHIQAIQTLVQSGAIIDAPNYIGETAMSPAIYSNDVETLNCLLGGSAPLNCPDAWGYVAILDAVVMDSHDILRLLLSASSDHGAKLFDGKTMLHIAGASSSLDTIEMLLDMDIFGVDPHAVDRCGMTALDYVKLRRDSKDLIEPFNALVFKTQNSIEKTFVDALEEKQNYTSV